MIINHISNAYKQTFTKVKNETPDKKRNAVPPADLRDYADLSISARMTSQLKSLKGVLKNIQQGRALVDKADAYIAEIQGVVQHIRKLAVRSANGIYTSEDRQKIQVQVSALVDEIDRIASQGNFNRFNLLTGDFSRTNPKA